MRIKPLALFTLLIIHNAYSEEIAANYSFDPAFLNFENNGKVSKPDLSYFSRPDGVLPGEYNVDVIFNNEKMGRETVNFVPTEPGKSELQLSSGSLRKWGVDITRLISDKDVFSYSELVAKIPNFSAKFNNNNQTLRVSVPQSWISHPEWSQTSPLSWDDGETAFLTNYRYSTTNLKYKSTSKETQTFSASSSLNIGGWRIRHNGYWSSKEKNWQSLNTFARHDYSFWQGGQFTVGQTSTSDGIFESFPFEGVSMASDDGMIVPSLVSFTPTVKGVANTPAQIIVRQNNTIIWQGDVPAGPFELRDIYPLYSGDMDVEIHESNGIVRHFTQASSTLPVLQHKDRIRYHLAVGRYRMTGNSGGDEPSFLQSSAAWGLGWDSTVYGGLIAAQGYRSTILGVGKYMPKFGALSVDLSHSESDPFPWSKSAQDHGHVTRLMYARGFESLGMQFNLTGYWYGGSDYYSFNDYQQNKSYKDGNSAYNQKSKIYAQILQSVGNFGQINFSTQWNEYENTKNGKQFRFSYSLPINSVSTSVSLTYNKQPSYKEADKSIYASLSVPFSIFTNYKSASLTSSVYNSGNTTTIQSGVNGSLLDQKLYYSVMEGLHKSDENANSGTAYLRYRSSKGEVQTSYAHQKYSKQLQFGAAGGVAVHRGGVTLTQTLSLDAANALINTNGVEGIKVKGLRGIFTDGQGYAVVPNLIPYQKNTVALDVTKVNSTTEIIKSDTMVTPSRGALVSTKFDVASGRKALINLVRENGEPVPFGSVASLVGKNSVNKNGSFVSDNGQVWMTGLPQNGEIKAQWGANDKGNCTAPFSFNNNVNEIKRLTLMCK